MAALGCGAESSNARSYTLGDTIVVENVSPLVADTVHPVEVQRYGRAAGELEYLFSHISSFAVGPAGEVYIHDDGEGIREYAPDGDFVGYVARQGEGPGEVQYVIGMHVSATGTLAAYDLGNSRISVWEDGRPVRVVRRPDGMPMYRGNTVVVEPDGALWVGVNPPHPSSGAIAHPRPVFVSIDPSGTQGDTLFTPSGSTSECPTLSDVQNRSGFWEDRREPFTPKVKWNRGPGGTFVVGCPRSFEFDVYRPDGAIVRVRRDHAAIAVSSEERSFWTGVGRMSDLPPERPAYVSFLVPGDGRVWVWPTQPSVRTPLDPEVAERAGVSHSWVTGWTGAFDVFNREGEWLAVVQLPPGARYSGFPTEPDVFVRGDTLWAVALDSMDVQYVVRYEVPELRGAS